MVQPWEHEVRLYNPDDAPCSPAQLAGVGDDTVTIAVCTCARYAEAFPDGIAVASVMYRAAAHTATHPQRPETPAEAEDHAAIREAGDMICDRICNALLVGGGDDIPAATNGRSSANDPDLDDGVAEFDLEDGRVLVATVTMRRPR